MKNTKRNRLNGENTLIFSKVLFDTSPNTPIIQFMNAHFTAIVEAVCEINRNLLLLRGECSNSMGVDVIDDTVDTINSFESLELHALRQVFEKGGLA